MLFNILLLFHAAKCQNGNFFRNFEVDETPEIRVVREADLFPDFENQGVVEEPKNSGSGKTLPETVGRISSSWFRRSELQFEAEVIEILEKLKNQNFKRDVGNSISGVPNNRQPWKPNISKAPLKKIKPTIYSPKKKICEEKSQEEKNNIFIPYIF